MKNTQKFINAQQSGTILKVKYKSGSQPNYAREIIPLKIENDKVLAKCLNSNSEKIFYITKLKLLNDYQYDHHEKWDPNFVPATDYEEYLIRKKKRYNLFRYFSLVLVILAISFVCFIFKSNIK